MANYKLILKNTTVVDIELDEGFTIPASGQIEIDPSLRHRFWDDIDVVGNLATLIRNGDVVINDGVLDIIPANGMSVERAINFLQFSDRAFNLRFLSEPERSNGFVSKNVQEAIEESRTSFEGKGFQTTFAGNGTFTNSWLSQEDTNVESNESPDIFKYKARFVGIDFTNQNNNIGAVVVIAIKEYPFNNLNNPDRFYKWTLDGVRSSLKTNQTSGFIVNPGDVMALYLVDNSGGGKSKSNDIIVTMDFIILQANNQEISNSYTGNFQSIDIPTLNNIPEILP